MCQDTKYNDVVIDEVGRRAKFVFARTGKDDSPWYGSKTEALDELRKLGPADISTPEHANMRDTIAGTPDLPH